MTTRFRSLTIAFLFFSFYVWLALAVFKPIGDFDFWWHLASGRYLVQNRIIPHVDVFSLTCRGHGWIDSYWLYEALIYGLYKLGGWTSILLANAALIVAIFYLLDRRLQLAKIGWFGRLTALAIFFVGGQARGDIWNVQASLISLFFVVWLLLDLEEWQRRRWPPAFWIWPFLFILWANMHRGFTVGIVLAGLTFIGAPGLRQDWKRRLLWLVSCGGATLVNPYHVGLYRMLWEDWHLSSQNVMSWSAPTWAHWEIFWISLIVLWLALAVRMIRKELRLSDLFLAVFLSWTSVHYAVNIRFLMAFALPLIACLLSDCTDATRPSFSQKRCEWPAIAIVLAGLLWAQLHSHSQGGIDQVGTPISAADLIEQNQLTGPFYNDYRFGGYWMWRFANKYPVFIDGRYPAVEGYDQLLVEINRAKYHRPEDWTAFLDRYHLAGALMKYPERSPYPALFDRYFPRQQWALVSWDDIALLFLRRTATNRQAITAHEFREISPDADFGEFMRRLQVATPAQKKRIEGELRHNLSLHPGSRLTQFLLSLYERT